MRRRADQSEMNRTQKLLNQKNRTQTSLSSWKDVSLKNKRNSKEMLSSMMEKRKKYENDLSNSRLSRGSKTSSTSLQTRTITKTFL